MAAELQGDRTVVVGIDGSTGSAAALQWAVDHADHLGAIVPTMTFVTGLYAYGFDPDDGSMDRGGPYRQEAVDRVRTFLQERQPALVAARSTLRAHLERAGLSGSREAADPVSAVNELDAFEAWGERSGRGRVVDSFWSAWDAASGRGSYRWGGS